MSQTNIEIVRRCIGKLNDRDWSAIGELFDPNCEIDLSRNVFNPDVYRGRAGLERWARGVEDVWDDFHAEVTELTDADETVVTGFVMRGKGRGSGVNVEMQLFQVWTLRDSKVLRIVGGYRDRSEALAAAGVSEPD